MPENLYGEPFILKPEAPKLPDVLDLGREAYAASVDNRVATMDDLYANINKQDFFKGTIKADTKRLSDVSEDLSGRYSTVVYGTNNEDAWAQKQGFFDKAANGILKGATLAATTFVGGIAGTPYGILKSLQSGKFSDIWDNEVFKGLNEINNSVEDVLPNFYTEAEKNATWYSPTNLFTANFLFDKLIKNAGFAVGAIYSGNLFAKGLGLAGEVLGTAFGAAADATSSWKTFSNINRYTSRLFSQGKNAEAYEVLSKGIKSTADAAARESELANIASQYNKINSFQDLSQRTAMSIYSSGGEAAFESINGANDFRQKQIQEYKDKWGIDPTGEDLEKIDQLSREAGTAIFGLNMAVLSGVEFMQLPYLIGSTYKGTRAAANAFVKAEGVAFDEATRQATKEGAKTVVGKALEKVTNIGKYVFDPKEMAEEMSQNAIQVGVQDYYNKKYKGREAKDFAEAFTDIAYSGYEGIKQTLTTKEGLESGLLGGISGGLMQARGTYRASKAREATQKSLIESLPANTVTEALKERIDSFQRGVVLQEEGEALAMTGNKAGFLDNKHDKAFNYLYTRIKHGRYDMVEEDIKDKRSLASTEDGFKQMVANGFAPDNISREDYLKNLNEFEQQAKNTKQIAEATQLVYSGRLNEQGGRMFPDAVLEKMSYAASKISDYDLRIPKVASNLINLGLDVDGIIDSELNDDASTALVKGILEIDKIANPITKDSLKQDLKDVVDLAKRRKQFINEYEDIKNNPEKYAEIEEEDEIIPSAGTKKTVKIKTKDGEEDIEVGTEYYLGSVVSYSKEGKEVYNFPKLTILGENEDGTIKIKGSTGIIKNISKEELASYKLGKVSDTEKNKKAKFYMDNINTVYEHYGIKVNGQPAKGRLQYSPKEGILLFVYKDAKGKIRTREIVGQDFKAKEGYQHGMIKAFGTLTAVQQKSEEEFAAERDARIEARRAGRLEILTDLFDNLSAKLDKTNSLIAQKKEQMNRIVEEMKVLEEKISTGTITKKNNFKSSTNKAIKAANRLSRMKETLRLEIEALEAEKDEIEFNQSYVADMAQNIDEFPEEGKDLLEDLNEQALNLNLLQESVGKQINTLSKLMDQVDGALKTAVDFALDLIKKFEAKYPNLPYTPLGLREFLNKDLSAKGVYPDYQSYLQANPNLLADLSEFERDIADIDELDVIPNERSLEELRKEMEGLQNQLKEVEKEIKAKELILNTFEEVAKKHKQQKEQEARLAKNEEFKQAILGTMVADQQTLQYDEAYEPDAKKDDITIVTSTKVPSKSDKPHHIRANKFGNNFPNLTNKANIRGVLITTKNQDSLIPGLIDRLFGEGTPEQKAGVIALVMVNTDGELVDVNGEVIPEGVDKLDNAIYQVMPDEGLEWSAEYSKSGKPSSMFRSTTPDNVKKALIEQYKTWRDGILSTVDLVQYRIDASFGILQNEKYTDDKGVEQTNYRAKNSVEEAGLVPKGLENNNVIVLRTTEGAEENGSVTFTNAKGRPLLKTANGLVKLNNRKFNEKEASLIYNMILRLSRNVEKDGNAKSADSLVILDWLKSVVYWGVPKVVDGNRKNPGYNSVWFERDTNGVLKLFLSGKGGSIPFGPLSIEENQDNLISLIQDMYNNVNATIINKSWNEPYSEIVGVKKDGSLDIKTWPNYQSYLLSNKDVEGNKRNAENIPLTTIARPLKSEEDVNREGVYFTIIDNADKFVIPKTVTTTPKVLTPTAPAAPVAARFTNPAPNNMDNPQYPDKPEFNKLPGKSLVPTMTYAGIGSRETPQEILDQMTAIAAELEEKENYTLNTGVSFKNKQEGADKAFYDGVKRMVNLFSPEKQGSRNKEQAIAKEIHPNPSALTEGGLKLMSRNTNQVFGDNLNTPVDFVLFWAVETDTNRPEGGTGQAVQMARMKGIPTINMANPGWRKELDAVLASLKAPVAPTPAAKIVVDGYTFDGEAKNNITLLGKYNVNFSYDAVKGVFQGELSGDGIEKAIADLGASEEQIKDAFAGSIVKTLAPQVEEYKKKVAEQTAPQSTAAVFTPTTPYGVPTGAPITTSTESISEGITESDLDKIRRQMMESSDEDGPVFREKIAKEIERFEGENWQKVEKWLKENFPNVPVYRVKNVIQATNGRQAWGMFQDGAIYIYENAEVGTVYHEVFEAVWKMFSDAEEQANVLTEFKARKGSFIDRPTGKEIKYSEATNQEAKEQLAEEFRDYVMYKKIPAKPASGRPFILKLFADLVSFIKEFFTGNKAESNIEKLFSKIGNGYYKQYSPYQSALSFAKEGIIDIEEAIANAGAEFSIIGMNGQERHDVIQNMTYLTLKNIFRDNKSFFTIPNINKEELYIKLKDQVQKDILKTVSSTQALIKKGTFTEKQGAPHIEKALALWKAVEDNWDEFKFKHEEYLRGYSIEFDESDNVVLTDENNSGKSDYQDARKIDNFKKANAAIKMLLSTIARVDRDGNMDPSTVNGAKLIPTSEVFMKVMNQVHSARTIEEMLQGLKELGLKDNNYKALYERLTKSAITVKGIDYSNLTEPHEAQLLASFWKTFKKMNADVKAVFILSNDDVVIGDANLSSAARQLRSDFISQIVDAIKTKKSSYFVYDDKTRRFKGEPKSVPKTLLSASARIAFLEKLGISFTEEELKSLNSDKLKIFNTAVDGIRTSIEQAKEIVTISGKVLDIEGQLLKLATIKAIITTPEFDSTYFNINGEKVQSFIGTNPGSNLYDVLSQINNLNDVPAQYQYLLTDSFVKNSVILNKMFNIETGEKREDIENYLSIGYVDGTINEQSGKKKESSKLTYRERLIQEINLNLNGYYMNLVPGDASMEWMAYMGNHVSVKRLRATGMEDVNKIFKGYFISELLLARDVNRNVKETKTRKSTDLRFFKPILGEKLHNDIVKEIGTPEEVYKKYESKINTALKEFIEKDVNQFKANLASYGIINKTELGWEVEDLALSESVFENIDDLNRELTALNVNFMINNIELHKLLYSDPYQYSDELKRIKNFLSPRQQLLGSDNINSLLNNVWNKGFKKGDLGYTDFTKNYFKTTTLDDIVGVIDLPGYKEYDETDGSGIISSKSYRNFRIRSGEWNENEELQYKFDIEFEEAAKSGASKEQLQKLLKKNPAVKSAYTPIKPIVSGNKDNGKNYNDVMLDKFALYPLSYRVMYEINASSNALKLYDKMQKEGIDYVVFKSARKVGAEKTNSVYNKDGSFNTNEFEGVFNVPFDIMSVQSEVPSKDTPLVTRGSQVTKLITMDYMEAGVPVDFEETKTFPERYKAWYALDEEGRKKESTLYKEIKNNQNLLEAIATEGYNSLLNKLHITETADGYVIEPENIEKVAEFLRQELLKREVNDNISEAVRNYAKGSVILEATPAYQQIRNILYSIADKEVISPKISGGLKVQIPAALLESTKTELREINGKLGYTSDTLGFYSITEDGKKVNVCEIMVGRWFKSDMSDEELLKYLNETPEGQKILSGLAYRIPTQKQNSIDVFKIKKFLPKEFGDSVIIPSALVQKVGSDFDIDKLSIYFKNVFKDVDGKIKLVESKGSKEETMKFYGEVFDKLLSVKKDQKEKALLQAIKDVDTIDTILNTEDETVEQKLLAKNKKLDDLIEKFGDLFDDAAEFLMEKSSELREKIKELNNEQLQKEFKQFYIEQKYKQSLENEYIESCEKLVSHPKNFKRLISPNSADQLKGLSKKISEKLGVGSFNYDSTGNMLNRVFMSRLRQAFVNGKYAIGIAAVSQTNHSLNQRSPIYIDKNKLAIQDAADREWLGDAEINFEQYNSIEVDGEKVPTLSMIENAEGQDISDINGQFIDGYVDISKGPWIMELGATPNVASTWLFLAKIGVPIDTIAYFMNQPIVRDYLKSIERSGYSWLFIGDIFEDVISKYDSSITKPTKIPSKSKLWDMIGEGENLSPEQKADQRFILSEFVKYAKMANQLYLVTQGSNFDTASFNDPFLVFKKMEQLKKAKTSIISSVDDILENSFIGNLSDLLLKLRNALSTILVSDQTNVRGVMEKVLLPYINESDRDFVKISQKAVNDLFDWAVQNDRDLNTMVQRILLEDNNVAKQMSDFIVDVKKSSKHPLKDNILINSLVPVFSQKLENGTNNLKIVGRDNKVYDQNQIIYAFEELKQYFKGIKSPLYGNLVRLAVLQSGLNRSPISFTSLIPYEDFKEIYNKTLSKLETIPNLNDFYKLGVFQRNNWNDGDVVPSRRLVKKQDQFGNWRYKNFDFFRNLSGFNKPMETGDIPQLIKFNTKSKEADSDYVVFTWEVGNKYEKEAMRKKGDYSYIKKGLFKKIYNGDIPFTNEYTMNKDGQNIVITEYIYKMVNAWGDSFRAVEMYDVAKKSKIDNGFLKVEQEKEDDEILSYLDENPVPLQTEITSSMSTQPTTKKTISLKDGKTYSSEQLNTKMLVGMGYTLAEAGTIIKNNKC